jgi:cytosine/adenosine deaminase-related metal-dependent hydrolase
MSSPDIVVRDAYLADRDRIVDIAIGDGTITKIVDELGVVGAREIDANGNLVSPGFVESHIHMDQAYSAEGERFPKYNDMGADTDTYAKRAVDYYGNTPWQTIEDRAVRLGKQAAANGVLNLRTHVNAMSELGTKSIETILAARERLEDIIDVQIVLITTNGILLDDAEDLVRDGLEMGADLVGGVDPASMNNDIETTIDTWFDIATDYDVEMDPHIHDPTTLGAYVLKRLAEKTMEYNYEGNVTASHCYALADLVNETRGDPTQPGFRRNDYKSFKYADLDNLLPLFQESDMKVTSSYPGSRPGMPYPKLQNMDIPVSLGSDNIHDFVIRHPSPDPLLACLVNAFKLDYSIYTYATNDGLDILWDMATIDGAEVLSIEDQYGVEEGNPANLVVLDQPSPQWAIIKQAERSHVIKDGQVVAERGNIVSEFDPLQ